MEIQTVGHLLMFRFCGGNPGTDYDKTGKNTGKGAFTIVEEAEGKGASLWGLVKSYQKNRDGWILLDYAERV